MKVFFLFLIWLTIKSKMWLSGVGTLCANAQYRAICSVPLISTMENMNKCGKTGSQQKCLESRYIFYLEPRTILGFLLLFMRQFPLYLKRAKQIISSKKNNLLPVRQSPTLQKHRACIHSNLSTFHVFQNGLKLSPQQKRLSGTE